ncbi:MAG: hypothetical protein C7B47_16965 [Sulfobacillus thermosulfidooxidans]|uniref:Uncharacterized protein n=1 Tax=Sulfobacillus thermosulfidooxidans TaxID=28034 RepID=A0A2T2WIB8_SULTH|nr:MAG: hypothetical protein C7B47_16965 [Sulfobacillus thermosulfidooxidans]
MAYLSTITVDPHNHTVSIADHGLVVTVRNTTLDTVTLTLGSTTVAFDTNLEFIRDPHRRATQAAIHDTWIAKAQTALTEITGGERHVVECVPTVG